MIFRNNEAEIEINSIQSNNHFYSLQAESYLEHAYSPKTDQSDALHEHFTN